MCSVVTLVVGLVAVCFLPQDGQFMSQLSMIQRVTVSSTAFFVLFYRYDSGSEKVGGFSWPGGRKINFGWLWIQAFLL